MNSQQYNRANKRVFLAVIIVFAYIAFTLFAAVGTKDADITRISIQLVAAIAVIVIAEPSTIPAETLQLKQVQKLPHTLEILP